MNRLRPALAVWSAMCRLLHSPMTLVLVLGFVPTAWLAAWQWIGGAIARFPGCGAWAFAIQLGVTTLALSVVLGVQMRYALAVVREQPRTARLLVPDGRLVLNTLGAVATTMLVAASPSMFERARALGAASLTTLAMKALLVGLVAVFLARTLPWGFAVAEGMSAVVGLRESFSLTRGSAWRVFGVYLLLMLVGIPVFLVRLWGEVPYLLGSCLLQPWFVLSFAEAYERLRERRVHDRSIDPDPNDSDPPGQT